MLARDVKERRRADLRLHGAHRRRAGDRTEGHLHIGGKSHLYRSSISVFLQRLDPQRFVRIHRSTVINTDRIRELRPRGHGDYVVVLHDGRELTLSRASLATRTLASTTSLTGSS